MSFEVVGLDEFIKDFRELNVKYDAATIKAARRTASKLESEIKDRMRPASGKLDVSVAVEKLRAKRYQLNVVFTEPYWVYVEYGTGPHWPPLEPILDWVKVKGLASSEGSARQIAFLIARKISRKGTPARRMLSRAMREVDLLQEFQEVMRELHT